MTVTPLRGTAATALALTLTFPVGSYAQDIPFDLGTLVLEGERSDRPLEETPASTTVITGDEAERPSNVDLRDAVEKVPNVVFDAAPLAPSIRGIDGSGGLLGGSAFTTATQPRVNVIVDGVPRPGGLSGSVPGGTSLWDTDQIEVARGPQSTLGGRNSLAGNIRVQTNDPVHFFEGAARTFAFNQDGTVGGALMLNMPIVQDQVALRFTAEASEGESFIDITRPDFADRRDFVEEERFRRYRAKLLFTPEALPDLRILATAERSERRALFSPFVDPGTFVVRDSDFPPDLTDQTADVFSLQANYALSDRVELEFRASSINSELNLPPFRPGFLELDQELDSVLGEALIRGENIGRVNRFVFGVTYEKQDENLDGLLENFVGIGAEGKIESLGIFGELDYALTDRLAIIAGGRIEHDDRERQLNSFGVVGAIDTSETAFIPKIGLRYELSEDVAIGYQYSEGFRPGGLTFDFENPEDGAVIYGSERLRQHEIYTRGTYLGGRATLNASAFYYTFSDAQTDGAGGIGPSGFPLFGNVPEARGYGLEVDGSYAFDNGIVLDAGLGLLDTKITRTSANAPQLQGQELPRAPNLNFSLGLSYASDSGWDASARLTHVGEANYVFGGLTQPSYTKLDLAAGYEFDMGNNGQTFRIDAFINNVTDERIVLSTADPSISPLENVGRPRTIGISGTLRF